MPLNFSVVKDDGMSFFQQAKREMEMGSNNWPSGGRAGGPANVVIRKVDTC